MPQGYNLSSIIKSSYVQREFVLRNFFCVRHCVTAVKHHAFSVRLSRSFAYGAQQIWLLLSSSSLLLIPIVPVGKLLGSVPPATAGYFHLQTLAISESSSFEPWLQLRFDYDTITIRRYHDAFDYDGSDRNYVMRSIRLRYDCDEKLTCSFFCSRRMETGTRDTW